MGAELTLARTRPVDCRAGASHDRPMLEPLLLIGRALALCCGDIRNWGWRTWRRQQLAAMKRTTSRARFQAREWCGHRRSRRCAGESLAVSSTSSA